eukprot:TRINITY_DN4798_c4_g1_i1.p1 TRINITY_DN4798_c4_g1~~TRINITY_DN4798_c4_g1_i1.p1  ORF type:complete len:230 (+),score=60.90 TRINITY_DN4798_c4_g1_i1:91-690(+)
MAFLAVNPDSFAACAPMMSDIPIDALKRIAVHTLKSCQRKKLPPSAEEYGRKLRQNGFEVEDKKVRSILNWVAYLYGEAVRGGVTEEQFSKRLRKAARSLPSDVGELLVAIWAKDGRNYDPPSSLCSTPQLIGVDWRIAFPVQKASEPPNLSLTFNAQGPQGDLIHHPTNMPYSSFVQFSKSIRQAHEALVSVSAPAGN